MQFVLGGKSYELAFENVVEAANRLLPDYIDGRHKYYVVIDDRRFPVKQLFAEATGLSRAEFITDDAFRHLKKLGFMIQQFNRPAGLQTELDASNAAGKPSAAGGASFAVSLEPDEDGYIVASCPQLPGCHSQGRSRQEAVRNIKEAIRGYIASMKVHGEEIPAVDWELVEAPL